MRYFSWNNEGAAKAFHDISVILFIFMIGLVIGALILTAQIKQTEQHFKKISEEIQEGEVLPENDGNGRKNGNNRQQEIYEKLEEELEGMAFKEKGVTEERPGASKKKVWSKSKVYENVLRFHIRANSDLEDDQNVKCMVRDAVLDFVQNNVTQQSLSLEETKKQLQTLLPQIKAVAQQVLEEKGYHYEATAYFTKEEFPVKQYGDMVFPEGEYEALRIDLGNAKGHNWWCMMYPSLCMVDSTETAVPEESKETLKNLIPAEDYEELLSNPENEIEIHSKLLDTVKEWF